MSTVQPAGFCHQVDNAVDQDNPHKLRTKIEIVAARKRKVGRSTRHSALIGAMNKGPCWTAVTDIVKVPLHALAADALLCAAGQRLNVNARAAGLATRLTTPCTRMD